MIQLSKNYSLPERQEEPIPIKVVGVGSAGSNALDRVLLDGMDKNDLVAINTDVQSLASSVAVLGLVAVPNLVIKQESSRPRKSVKQSRARE
jgi:cell division GTPase FtsZ